MSALDYVPTDWPKPLPSPVDLDEAEILVRVHRKIVRETRSLGIDRMMVRLAPTLIAELRELRGIDAELERANRRIDELTGRIAELKKKETAGGETGPE